LKFSIFSLWINRRLFWSDWNREYPKIEFSGLDGLGRQTLVGEGLALPNSLVVDAITDQLCWADAGTHRIGNWDTDGQNLRDTNLSLFYLCTLIFYRMCWN
jgi:nidogen (entactin)